MAEEYVCMYVCMNNAMLMFSRQKDTLLAGRELYGHMVQLVTAQWIVHKFLRRWIPSMDQAWKSINGFIVSLTSSFDQLKI